MSLARIVSGVRSTLPRQTTIKPCLNKRFISINKSFLKRDKKDASFSTNPYNEAMDRFKTQAKMVGKMTAYTTLSMTTAIAFVWQASHWYIEYVMQPTPTELGYQARNLLHGAYIRETIAPDFEIASFYVREALRIALEEKHLEENSNTVIELRLRLAHDETHAGNLLDAITEYTRAWKLMMDKKEDLILVAETAKHIGDLYLRIGDYKHAEEFLAWSLHNLNDKDALLQSKVTLTLASLYAEDAICLKAIAQNQLSEAMYGLGKLDESMGWAQAALESCAQDVKEQDCLECGGVAFVVRA